MNKSIAICTYNYFTTKYQVGSHNYAKAFAKLGYKVAFISNPISPLHYIFANNDDLKKRDEIHSYGGVWEDNIWYYVPKAILTPQNKPILSSKYIFNNWYKFTTANLLDILKENGFGEVDILWIESPLFSFMLDVQKYDKSILRLADFSKGFEQNWDMTYQKEIEISKKVDKVVYTAKKLKEYYHKIDSSKMQYIPNGIDLELVQKADKSMPQEFEGIKPPKVIYVGLIDYWFDVELVYKSAITYPNYSFILIGDVKIDIQKLEELTNVYLLGTIEHKDLGKYLANSQIGIIPFIKSDFVDSINPIKLYEYAAYGLKIVSTSWKEVEELDDKFCISKTKEEFIKSLESSDVENKLLVNNWLEKQDWTLKVKKAIKFENID